jgi:hypothetical protein
VTFTIRPSDGAVRSGPYINLNWRRLKAGERVLYEPEYGRPRVGDIGRLEGNTAMFVPEDPARDDWDHVLVNKVRGRILAGAVRAVADQRQREAQQE